MKIVQLNPNSLKAHPDNYKLFSELKPSVYSSLRDKISKRMVYTLRFKLQKIMLSSAVITAGKYQWN